MKRRWNDTDKGTPKYLEKTLSQYQFVHQKSNTKWPGIEARIPRWDAGD